MCEEECTFSTTPTERLQPVITTVQSLTAGQLKLVM